MISPGLIVAAHIAGKQIAENMRSSGSDDLSTSSNYSEMSSKDRKLLAEIIALKQCEDLTNIPKINEHIYVDTSADRRLDMSCYQCKYSKIFNYIDAECEENPEDSKRRLICLKMLIEFPVESCEVDDEHYCDLFEQQNSKKCEGCNHDD